MNAIPINVYQLKNMLKYCMHDYCLGVWEESCSKNLLLSDDFPAKQVFEDDIYPAYRNRHFHDLQHILEMLLWADYYGLNHADLSLAIWFHDIVQNPLCDHEAVTDSADKADKILRDCIHRDCYESDFEYWSRVELVLNTVRNLIMATSHTKIKYSELKGVEKAIVSLDLICLGYDWKHYMLLQNSLKEEVHQFYDHSPNFEMQWHYGRTEFINEILSKECIYPWSEVGNFFEYKARENLLEEKRDLGKNIIVMAEED